MPSAYIYDVLFAMQPTNDLPHQLQKKRVICMEKQDLSTSTVAGCKKHSRQKHLNKLEESTKITQCQWIRECHGQRNRRFLPFLYQRENTSGDPVCNPCSHEAFPRTGRGGGIIREKGEVTAEPLF